jgi:protein-glutamine gamma-glutamyltransferase
MNSLDKIRIENGADKLKAYFNDLYVTNKRKAIISINDPQISFPTLYILRPAIEKFRLTNHLSNRNLVALNISGKIPKHILLSLEEASQPLLKWIFETGASEDDLGNEYDSIMDITAAMLVIIYKNNSILPLLIDMIFKRRRRGAFNHDLIWVSFQSRQPEALKLIAEHVLSPQDEDYDLARELLDFIPTEEDTLQNRNKLFISFTAWISENKDFLCFTGESYQCASKPLACFVDFDAKHLHSTLETPSINKQDPVALETFITIKNTPPDYTSLLNEYPQNSIERSVLDKINSSVDKYNYDSLDQLRFELMLRREIVNSAKALNRSGFKFEVFRDAYCNPEFWDISAEGGFILKEGVKASDAIMDIYRNGSKYGTECATAMVIVYYKALLEIYPGELYNNTFKKIHLMNWHYLDRNLSEIGYTVLPKDYLPGDRRYVKNPDVDPQTPWWQGENIIDLDNGLYYGHGIGIHKVDTIIRELNKNRKQDAQESAFLMSSVSRPDFKNLANIYYKYLARIQSQ